MYLCDDGHNEICYESKKCPCCELLKEIKILEEEIAILEEEIEILRNKDE